jgi:hypothetical protein
MSILLYHFKQLTAYISEVERIEVKVEGLQKTEEKEGEGITSNTTADSS